MLKIELRMPSGKVLVLDEFPTEIVFTNDGQDFTAPPLVMDFTDASLNIVSQDDRPALHVRLKNEHPWLRCSGSSRRSMAVANRQEESMSGIPIREEPPDEPIIVKEK